MTAVGCGAKALFSRKGLVPKPKTLNPKGQGLHIPLLLQLGGNSGCRCLFSNFAFLGFGLEKLRFISPQTTLGF